jgi:hypothetical protein
VNAVVDIKPPRADHPQVVALLETGSDQREVPGLYKRCCYTRRGEFSGCPDNGLSLFMSKVLS